MAFRDRLLATIRAARPVLSSPGILVALGLVATTGPGDIDELAQAYGRLRPELRHVVKSNLTILSLLEPRVGMPDPQARRADVAALLRRLEAVDPDAR